MKNNIKLFENARLGEKYYEIEHKSEMRIFVFPKDFSSYYAVVGVKFGSCDMKFKLSGDKNFTDLPAGTAHFLEHKMFENADGVNSDEHFAALGADDNAYTTATNTRYLFSTTENFDECLTELLRMVTHPHFTDENVKKERGIIAQEIKMYADSPYDRGYENLLRGLYHKNSIRENICGSVRSIGKITPDLLYNTCRVFYNPANMALAVSGRITPEQVLAVCDRELDEQTELNDIVRFPETEPESVASKRTVKKMKVSRPLFFLGVKDNTDKLTGREGRIRRAGMTILNNMLFSSSGEFYNRLLSERLISPAFSFGYTTTATCAFNYFSGESDEPERVVGKIFEKIDEVKRDGFEKGDFERCRRVALSGFIKSFDSVDEIADDIVMSAHLSGCNPFDLPEIIGLVTEDYCRELLFEVFREERTALSLVLPLD